MRTPQPELVDTINVEDLQGKERESVIYQILGVSYRLESVISKINISLPPLIKAGQTPLSLIVKSCSNCPL